VVLFFHASALTLLAAMAKTAVPAAGDPVIAAFSVQDRAGDAAAAAALDEALRFELAVRGRLVERDTTRRAQRRLRVRNGDRAEEEQLRRLGAELGADLIVSATLHDAERRFVPSLAASVRVYSAATGTLSRATFRGQSGLDRRSLLGLGTIEGLEALVPVVAGELVDGLPGTGGEAESPARGGRLGGHGTLALVPFTGTTEWRATQNAETVTEAARARLLAQGLPLISPNVLQGILRRLQGGAWGGVTAETRAALREQAGAVAILTGSVEAYAISGSGAEPEPYVTVALRVVEATTGRVLWTGSMERRGWDHGGLFRRGRVYSRGELTEQILEKLTARLEQDGVLQSGRSGAQ